MDRATRAALESVWWCSSFCRHAFQAPPLSIVPGNRFVKICYRIHAIQTFSTLESRADEDNWRRLRPLLLLEKPLLRYQAQPLQASCSFVFFLWTPKIHAKYFFMMYRLQFDNNLHCRRSLSCFRKLSRPPIGDGFLFIYLLAHGRLGMFTHCVLSGRWNNHSKFKVSKGEPSYVDM